jgi:flagellar biogenesis protein FliO
MKMKSKNVKTATNCSEYEKNNREDFIFTMLMYSGIIGLLIFSGWIASKL